MLFSADRKRPAIPSLLFFLAALRFRTDSSVDAVSRSRSRSPAPSANELRQCTVRGDIRRGGFALGEGKHAIGSIPRNCYYRRCCCTVVIVDGRRIAKALLTNSGIEIERTISLRGLRDIGTGKRRGRWLSLCCWLPSSSPRT